MKKVWLLIIAPFVFLFALSAQVAREEADEIVLEYMNIDLWPYTVYAKDGVQTEMIITSSAGEILEITYSCRVYYINYADNTGSYLIVNKDNGNLLEINTKDDAAPDDLAEWRVIAPIEISSTNFRNSPYDYCCIWNVMPLGFDFEKEIEAITVMNSNEDLEENFTCYCRYPEFDFSTQTCLWAGSSRPVMGFAYGGISTFLKIGANKYVLDIPLFISTTMSTNPTGWATDFLLIPKIDDNATIMLNVRVPVRNTTTR